jgi:hypothetical protein
MIQLENIGESPLFEVAVLCALVLCAALLLVLVLVEQLERQMGKLERREHELDQADGDTNSDGRESRP